MNSSPGLFNKRFTKAEPFSKIDLHKLNAIELFHFATKNGENESKSKNNFDAP